MAALARLLSFLYLTRRRRLLGVSWATWIRLAPLMLSLVTLSLGRPVVLTASLLLIFLALLFIYAVAERMGYKQFVPDAGFALKAPALTLPANERVSLQATGIFSLKDREHYVLQSSAAYWRIPLGKHIIMVQLQPGSFLYQVFASKDILAVRPGYLISGSRPQRALSLTFFVSWGPEFADYRAGYYVGPEQAPTATQQRTVYLAFTDEEALHRVWHSLVDNSSEQVVPAG